MHSTTYKQMYKPGVVSCTLPEAVLQVLNASAISGASGAGVFIIEGIMKQPGTTCIER